MRFLRRFSRATVAADAEDAAIPIITISRRVIK